MDDTCCNTSVASQELITKREAELQGVQEALQKDKEKLQQLQSHKQEKTQEPSRCAFFVA